MQDDFDGFSVNYLRERGQGLEAPPPHNADCEGGNYVLFVFLMRF